MDDGPEMLSMRPPDEGDSSDEDDAASEKGPGEIGLENRCENTSPNYHSNYPAAPAAAPSKKAPLPEFPEHKPQKPRPADEYDVTPYPDTELGDDAVGPAVLDREALLGRIQTLLASTEPDLKRLLTEPGAHESVVQLDVCRAGKSNRYRCYMRLDGTSDSRVCIFEASRSRKGKLSNSKYAITLPARDGRLRPTLNRLGQPLPGAGQLSKEEREAALYCGKLRSYSLSGGNFVVYDDGMKPEAIERTGAGRPRRQLASLIFDKQSTKKAPMSMRMLLPNAEERARAVHYGSDQPPLDVHAVLQSLHPESPAAPKGFDLLKLAQPLRARVIARLSLCLPMLYPPQDGAGHKSLRGAAGPLVSRVRPSFTLLRNSYYYSTTIL